MLYFLNDGENVTQKILSYQFIKNLKQVILIRI